MLTVSSESLFLIIALVLIVAATAGFFVARRGRAGGRTVGGGAAGEDRPTLADVPLPDHDVAAFGTPEVVDAGPALLERPEAAAGRLVRLRERLSRSGAIGSRLLAVLSRDHLTEADWEEIEETLLLADVGVAATAEIMDALRTRVRVLGTRDVAAVRAVLREILLDQVGPDMDRDLALDPTLDVDGQPHPATVLVVGVNGDREDDDDRQARPAARRRRDRTSARRRGHVPGGGGRAARDVGRAGRASPVVRAERTGADPAAVAFDAVRPAPRDRCRRRRSSTPPGGCRTRRTSWTSWGRSVASSSRQAPRVRGPARP